eukprot:TRINITY_DN30442_c0_g1_i1.p1 TRINITY_DN30442_c0_g1~~TRINITY_DN30442_c0_g1_i1.p1  ORF type:complete len:172 (+),score=31.71 TRINITY_DN30442_c0_g1_i1:67-516(+)
MEGNRTTDSERFASVTPIDLLRESGMTEEQIAEVFRDDGGLEDAQGDVESETPESTCFATPMPQGGSPVRGTQRKQFSEYYEAARGTAAAIVDRPTPRGFWVDFAAEWTRLMPHFTPNSPSRHVSPHPASSFVLSPMSTQVDRDLTYSP